MTWKNVAVSIAALVLILFAFFTWYKLHFSMTKVESFEVNTPALEQKVLIATQGSEFKNAVVAGLIAHLKQRPAYIKVIDVAELAHVNEAEWSAVVVIHTWENWKPQPDAKAYVDRAKGSRKLIVLGTSGRGDFKMEGVDAIASASVMTDAPARISEISTRLDAILGGNVAK